MYKKSVLVKEIRKIIEVYDSIDHSREKIALASVVNVEESSYRRIGARMLVRSTGMWTGGISGGCLEGDALRRSQAAIFKNAASRIVYDTMDDDKNQIGVGLGCNGRIEVLLTPIDPNDPNNEIEQLKKIADADSPSIMLKVIEAPEEEEEILSLHKLINPISKDVEFAGINANKLAACIDHVVKKKRAKTFYVNSEAYGEIKILVEFIRPETKLIIVGDNYDVNAMLGIAKHLGWEPYIVGKAKKLSKDSFRQAKQVLDYDHAHKLKVNEYTAVILMSHDYDKDVRMLPVFIEKKPAYIGMLGPKKRFHKINNEYPDIELEDIDFIFSPTGLEIGAESPEEIALSIAAEIVAKMRNKQGGSLRLKEGTIHEREYETHVEG